MTKLPTLSVIVKKAHSINFKAALISLKIRPILKFRSDKAHLHLEQSEALSKMETRRESFKAKAPVVIKLIKVRETGTKTLLTSPKDSKLFQCQVLLRRVDIDSESCKYKKAKHTSKSGTHNETQLTPNSADTKNIFNKQPDTLPILFNAEVSNDAASGLCQFDCLECHKSFFNWVNKALHVNSQHNKSISMKNFKDYLYKVTIHICQICSERVLSDSRFLSHHFGPKHGLSLNEYRQKFKCDSSLKKDLQSSLERGRFSQNEIGNLCTYRCKGCNNVYHSSQTFQRHNLCKSANCPITEDTPQWQTSLEKVVKHKCKLCSKVLLCDTRNIINHILKKHDMKSIGEYAKKTGCTVKKSFSMVTLKHDTLVDNSHALVLIKIGNYCSFTCAKCDHKSSKWCNMRRHLKSTHKLCCRQGDWHNFVSKAVMHKCHICREKILNDYEFISTHMRNRHHISYTNYKDTYVLS